MLYLQVFNNGCRDEGDKIHEIAVKPEKDPEFRRHGKGNVLPNGSGKGVKAVFDPDVSSPFSARWAESGFAAVGNFGVLQTGRTNKVMITVKRSSA